MPVNPTFPGVYIEEIPSGVRTITGVATSITAFIGRALRGPTSTDDDESNRALTINSFADFERIYGGLWSGSSLGYAVRDFFVNGGTQAIIVRLYHLQQTATIKSEDDARNSWAAALDVANTAATAAQTANAKPQDVASAARNMANTHTADPAKTSADTVAKAAENEANNNANATVASVSSAAFSALSQFAPPKTSFPIAGLQLEAAYEGSWGQYLRAHVEPGTSDEIAKSFGLKDKTDLFSLTVSDVGLTPRIEQYQNLTLKGKFRRIDNILASESKLVRWAGAALPDDPTATPPVSVPTAAADDDVTTAEQQLATDLRKIPPDANKIQQDKTAIETAQAKLAASDGQALTINDFIGQDTEKNKQGLFALEEADLFNILCIPPYSGEDVDVQLVSVAAAYCEQRRAMLLVDPLSTWIDKDAAKKDFLSTDDKLGTRSKNAALFFPRIKQADPLRDNQLGTFVPCGTIAGIFARTDTQRGVWKAPAGLDASLVGVLQLGVSLTDAENGELNQLGINCLRTFPAVGHVVWGSRTLQGADRLSSEWKYISVRRTALYIEESLYRGTQWVVFEPNDEPLWAQIRLNVGAFMQNLFRQGAFQGQTPRDAYFVKCDKETTTQNDIDLGIVNIVVGFAPLKPAEFVVIKLQQMAGQIQV